MKIRHHLLAVFLIITLLVTSGCSASGSSAASATTSDDTWTVLFYMCGTDLESDSATEPGGSYNLREITKTTPTDNVHFIVETGGCKEWHAKDLGLDISTDKLQRYSYTKEGFELVDETIRQTSTCSSCGITAAACTVSSPTSSFRISPEIPACSL